MTLPSDNPNITLSLQDHDNNDRDHIPCAIANLARDNTPAGKPYMRTIQETAEIMGCSCNEVRCLEASALRKLRNSKEVCLLADELGIRPENTHADSRSLEQRLDHVREIAIDRQQQREHLKQAHETIPEKRSLHSEMKPNRRRRVYAPLSVQTNVPAQITSALRFRALRRQARLATQCVMLMLSLCVAPVTRAADRMWMNPVAPPAHCPDQAETGACALFAFAAWAQARTDVYTIPDSTIIDIYRRESMRRHGRDNAKLTIPQAFAAARANGIVPAQASCVRVYGLASVALGPLVAGYRHTQHWHATAEDGRIAEGGTVDGDHALLITGRTDDGKVWLRNSRGPDWGVNGFGWISEYQHNESIIEMWHVMLPGGARSASEAAALSLADKIGLHVRALRKALVTLGYDIPCDSQAVMTHTIARSMENQLTPEQERAKADAAMIYMLLQRPTADLPGGVSDEMIEAVWGALKWR